MGYARVSSVVQDTALQLDALKRAGVRKIFSEKTSSIGARPELQRAFAYMKPHDVLVVYKLDRVARSLKDLLVNLERLEARQCGLRSLTEPIDTGSPAGRLMIQILGSVAEFERSLIRERTLAGQAAARLRGSYVGRPPHLDADQRREVIARLQAGERACDLANEYAVNDWVIRRASAVRKK